MKLNISPSTVTSKLISSLIRGRSRGEQRTAPKEGVDLVGIAQKLFANKRSKIDEEKASEAGSNE